MTKNRLTRLVFGSLLAFIAACSAEEPTSPGTQNPPPPPSPNPVVTGTMVMTVTGLESSGAADIVVSGPSGYSRSVTASTSITNLASGRYTVTARPVISGGRTFQPSMTTQTVDISSELPVTVSVAYSVDNGVLVVAVNGLPGGTNADISMTPPSGPTFSINATQLISGALPGRWRLSASPVSSGGSVYKPTPASYDLNVAVRDTTRMPVNYSLTTGSIAVAIMGLPEGHDGYVVVTGPGSYRQTVTSTQTLIGLVPGTYQVVASDVLVEGVDFVPTPASHAVEVVASLVATPAPVTYSGLSGTLSITTTGLPAGVTPTFTLSGVSSSQSLSGTPTLSLAIGSYTVNAATIVSGTTTYTPTPATRTVAVTQGGNVSAAFAYAVSVSPGTLNLTINGLSGASADVLVTGPNSFARVVTSSSTLGGLEAGTYTILARAVRTPQGVLGVTPASREVDIIAGSNISQTLTYGTLPAVVDVQVLGLPGGASSAISLTSPTGANYAVTSSMTVSPALTGRWRLSASSVSSGGSTYGPTPASYDQTVAAGDTAYFPVSYAITTGSIAIVVSGLPGGVNGNVAVTGPGGFSQTVTSTSTLTNLTPGSYTVAAATVVSGATTFTASPSSRTVAVTASLVAAAAPVTYTSTGGSISITVSGLSGGTAADLLVTGPNSFSQAVTGSGTIGGLLAGTYTITARDVRAAQGTFSGAPASQSVAVTASGNVNATVTYNALPAYVNIPVTGLPGGASASISITPPTGSPYGITTSTQISPAPVGRWRLSASPISSGGSTYAPSPASYDQIALAGDTLQFAVDYAVSTGSIAISIAGLPGAVNGNVTVTGPNSYSQAVTGTTTLTNLTPGSYAVTATAVTNNGTTYSAAPASRSVTVLASLVAAAAPVTYTAQLGQLSISTSGLPGSVTPTFTLTGPSGSRALSGAGTTDSLAPGSYTLAVATIVSGSTTYTPSAASTPVTISTGATTNVSLTYTSSTSSGATNLSIENVYVTQSVQTWGGTAKLIASRDALVRVFVKAAGTNTLAPDVRVRVYNGATLLQTSTISATSSGVPTSISEGSMSASWNVLIPAANMTTGLRVLADVDPNNTLGESDRTDNIWPSNGTPATITTVTAPTLTVKFVPVLAGGLTGNVTDANKDQFLTTTRRMLPVNQVNASVRATYTSSVTALQSDNANGGWTTILSELNALRSADGAPSTTHYYGVVKVSYFSGVAGYGYIPGRAALGWDYLPTGDGIAAHELGHNFSRPHTPCGVSGDASYPYAGGTTGAWGWNSSTNALIAPTATDVMGYCSNVWISDWTWGKMVDYRSAAGAVADANVAGDGLLIWGRVTDGRVTLEPAFRVHARPTPAVAKSSHRVAITDVNGATLLSLPINAERVDHESAHDERQFAVVVPWSEQLEQTVANISVIDARSPIALASRSSVTAKRPRTAAPITMPEPTAAMHRLASTKASIDWNANAYPMALVRDANSGEILAFLRRSGDGFVDAGRAVDVVFSDGVRSTTKRVAPTP